MISSQMKWFLLAAFFANLPAMASTNLAFHGHGGVVAWYTSRDKDTPVGRLIDQKTEGPGWRSSNDYLPQEIVFAFRDDRLARVDKVLINPSSTLRKETWARTFLLYVSTNNPVAGFREVGEFRLSPAAIEQAFRVNQTARFLKLRILSNGGGSFTSLGEVKILGELLSPTEPDRPEAPEPDNPPGRLPPTPEGHLTETEPNNSPQEAGLLPAGRFLHAAIDPPGENDFYHIPLERKTVVTFGLRGRPNIRTSMALLGEDGTTNKLFDPGTTPLQETEFSWLMPPGKPVLRLNEPAASLVMIWDTSGSMRGKATILEEAVVSYLDAVQPGEHLKLIRFSRSVEVINTNFLNQPADLRKVATNKFRTQSGTALYDAMSKGIELLEKLPGNRGIILMTDGKDSASKASHEAFWKTLIDKRIRFYTIGLGGNLNQYVTSIGTSGTRFLRHAALATDGQHFHAEKAEELKGLYEVIAQELRTRSIYQLRATPSPGTGQLIVESLGEPIVEITAPPRIELILDASASMRGKLGRHYKMNLAKRAMSGIIRDLPDNIQVALRFFGHRIPLGSPEGCEDSELVFPFGPINKPRLLSLLQDVRTAGTTPFAYTLRQVGSDFEDVEGTKSIVIVTDGQDECGGDPVAAVKALLKQGLNIRVNIVGFDLADESTKANLQEITYLTRGQFYDTHNAKDLSKALRQSVAVPFQVTDAADEVVMEGMTGPDAWAVPSGIFNIAVESDESPLSIREVRIEPGRTTRVTLRKEGQEIGVKTAIEGGIAP